MSDHLQPRLRVLLAEAIAIGPGKAELLRHIRATGSISAAARCMHMSYRRAWLLVDTMNHSFLTPVVSTATGGSHGGGAHLTEMGEEVLRRYETMEEKANAALAPDIAEFRKLMQLQPREQPKS
ncbi:MULTISPECIES: winged helix-turn-helix domain-containing protein [Acidithiobacillus]|jgi:molybdate transport system regulatory protein|uniref:LysR family transcriptional regulator n=1 Tax=Acidithiobacillus thiooxidans ATCC 19377 TaxID=637390 RepID=A0A5P9XTX5_ACITH|nr:MULTISPECIES: winged helix-turn-helix domain-containing protein [Acidithiobacillus]MBU2740826.1 LysR family transcriptional regulator [Acidithiobacillus albertensis]MBU2834677.1 LysR family transcriptional regulator [Acidithiobacillus thiooxidans]MDA8177391.1 winged helix-turn-helix domain-containing protein [Acidithiobacillus sp.]QFX97109.1 LysR family transcriptional regulator [Acidithiobacillus thiooxidans ATCC 19377]